MGSAVSAAGSIFGGIASSNAADYQAQVARNNATINSQNATYATQAGVTDAFNTSLANRAAAGRIVANQSANGLNVNTGSQVAVQQTQREVGLTNVGNELANSQRTAYGYRVQAVGDEAQARLDQQQATNALVGSALGATGQLAGGSGQPGNSLSFLSSLNPFGSSGSGDPTGGNGG